MIQKKFAAIAFSLALLTSVAAGSLALADGMPEAKKPPATPLDKAIEEIQNKEPPVSVTKAPEAPPPIEQTPPPAPPPPKAPAPESRIVEVQPNTSFFGLSIGAYDPIPRGRKLGAAFNLEWQPGVHVIGTLQPIFGAMVTTRGSMMGYAGIGVPIHLGSHFYLMPSAAVGAYGKGGGVDLGRVLAFRVGSEIGYEFDDKSRIGLNIHAIGNGKSLDRRDRTEVISLVYTTPLNLFSGSPKTSQDVQSPAPAAKAAPSDAPAADKAVDDSLKK